MYKVEDYTNGLGQKRSRVKLRGRVIIDEVTPYVALKAAKGMQKIDDENRGLKG